MSSVINQVPQGGKPPANVAKGILAVLPEVKKNQHRMNILMKSLVLASEEIFSVDSKTKLTPVISKGNCLGSRAGAGIQGGSAPLLGY